MNIALIGYGKMGKAIEQIALKKGHSIVAKIDQNDSLNNLLNQNVDVVIEFTNPSAAFENIKFCLDNHIPVVSGTTGWLENYKKIVALTVTKNGAFFYTSNFSIGVNIFYQINKKLAKIMNDYPEYTPIIEEIHHTQKIDAPSGTAISLAEGIIKTSEKIENWVNTPTKSSNEIEIISKRIDNVLGTHTISYNSIVDSIEIKHTAHSREGFASGAIVAAEFIKSKKGVFGMNELLKI